MICMDCTDIGSPAVAVCVDCGAAICRDHVIVRAVLAFPAMRTLEPALLLRSVEVYETHQGSQRRGGVDLAQVNGYERRFGGSRGARPIYERPACQHP